MNCGSSCLQQFIDLNIQPNGNHFPGKHDFKGEPRFPFAMDVCVECWQVQIEESPSPEFMFSNHPYITGDNMPVIDHFKIMVDRTLSRFDMDEGALVLDIGANDGTLLSIFQSKGMRVLGIDPGQRTGKIARKAGITLCETFWNHKTALALKELNVRPNLITATAVFYHIESLHSFIRGLREVMTEETVFMTQCVYLKDVLEKCQFDHFYHEHTMIHAITPLKRIFESYGMRLLDVDYYDVHGGSFVLYVGLQNHRLKSSNSISHALKAESEAGLHKIDTYLEFTRKVKVNRDDLLCLLNDLKSQGRSVYALGAPLKGSTLLNYCGIGPDLIECATEVNRFKIGKYTPGTHIPIVDERTLKKHPDYYLLLSWNFLDFFLQKYSSYLKSGGKFIIPHPEVRVLGQNAT